MNWRTVFAIAIKDLREALRNPSVLIPMIVVPLIFVILLPLMAALLPALTATPEAGWNDPDLANFFANMPVSIRRLFAGLDPLQSATVLMAGMMFAPLFLTIPLMFATVIAAEAFAGERERKTIEALLYTPASDAELFLGKVLSALIPSLLITFVSFFIYAGVANLATWLVSRWAGWFPLPSWYVLIFWVAPAFSLLGISFTVLISSRNPTFMGAYQSSAALVILVVALMGGQLAGVIYLTIPAGLLIGLLVWLVAGVLTYFAIRSFNRQKLLGAG